MEDNTNLYDYVCMYHMILRKKIFEERGLRVQTDKQGTTRKLIELTDQHLLKVFQGSSCNESSQTQQSNFMKLIRLDAGPEQIHVLQGQAGNHFRVFLLNSMKLDRCSGQHTRKATF